MIKKLKNILIALFVAVVFTLSYSTTCFAIANPDDIDFGTGSVRLYNIYENVLETGDMLIVVEGYVHYAVTPTDYTAGEAFLFELINPTGTTTIVSTPLNDYEDRPISIYLSATQVTTLGLVSGTDYGIRITPNPLLLATEFGGGGVIEGTNQVTAYLTPANYVDQKLGADSDPPRDNTLRNGMMAMAVNIEASDAPADPYIIYIQGYRYLTSDGGDIFIEGIPSLTTMCSILFQSGLERMSSDPPESTGTYALTLTPGQKWGSTVADGLTNLGLYLGINQALAGSVVLFAIAIALAVFLYSRTQSGIAVLLIVSTVPFLGAYLGLMPLALAFIFVIIVITLGVYFFFARGAL